MDEQQKLIEYKSFTWALQIHHPSEEQEKKESEPWCLTSPDNVENQEVWLPLHQGKN